MAVPVRATSGETFVRPMAFAESKMPCTVYFTAVSLEEASLRWPSRLARPHPGTFFFLSLLTAHGFLASQKNAIPLLTKIHPRSANFCPPGFPLLLLSPIFVLDVSPDHVAIPDSEGCRRRKAEDERTRRKNCQKMAGKFEIHDPADCGRCAIK